MYIKKYWGNFIGGSDDSLNLVAFLEDQKKEEISLSEIFAKIGLDKQNWDFRQTVEYLEFTHSNGVEMDFHFAIDVVTDLAAILLECSVSGSVNLQDLDEYNTPVRRIRITATPEEHDAMNKSLADFVQNPLEYDLSEMMDDEEIQEMAQDVEALRKELYEASGRNRNYHVKAEDVKPLLSDWKGADGCIATNRITVEGCKVGYCYREKPDGDWDSGWRFTAGDESDEYMDDPNNAGIYGLNSICNDDPDIIPLLNTPAPCAFERDENGVFQQIKDWKPDEDEEDPDMDILQQCQKWHEEDKFQKIIDALEAIPAEGRTPEMDMELARAYNNLADPSEPEGRKLLHRALELMQSHEEALGDTYSWNFRMGYSYFYLDQEGRALRYFEKALELHPGDDPKLNTRQDIEELIDWCKKGISLPQFWECFRERTEDWWETFAEMEAELRQMMDEDKDHTRGAELVAQMQETLNLVFDEISFEMGFNGKKHELILTPEGDKVKLFELVYFQKHAPKEVLEHWNILVGRQPLQNIGLRTDDGWDISGEDVQIWLEEQGENSFALSAYCEKLLPMLREAEGRVWWMLTTLTDQVLGEIPHMRYIGSFDVLEEPKAEPSMLMSQLPDALKERGLELSTDPEAYLDSYLGYKMEPNQDPDADWRLDVMVGSTNCVPLINGYLNADNDFMDDLHADGAVAGFFCYPLDTLREEEGTDKIFDFRDKLEEVFTTGDGPEVLTLTGGATGLYCGYVDFIAWDIHSALQMAKEFFEGTDIPWASFHTFRREAGTVNLKTPPEKEPDNEDQIPELDETLTGMDYIPYTQQNAEAFFAQLEQWNDEDEYTRCIQALNAIPKDWRNYRIAYTMARALENYAILGDHNEGTPNYKGDKALRRAIQVLESVREEGQDKAQWNMRMAYAYQYLYGQEEKAIPYAQRWAELDPEDEDAPVVIQECQKEIAKRAEAENEDESDHTGVFTGFVLLSKAEWDKGQFIRDMKEKWDIPVEEYDASEEKDDDALVFEVGDMLAAVSLATYPIPGGEAEANAENNYMWEDAVKVAKEHSAHIMVAVLGKEEDLLEKGKLFTKVVAACCRQEYATGIYTSGVVFEPRFYEGFADMMRDDELPIFNWIWFGLWRDENGMNGYTYGLDVFGKDEMEVLGTDAKPSDLRDFLASLVSYVLENDVELHDGETIGFAADDKHTITRSPGVGLPEGQMTLKIGYEPIKGDPKDGDDSIGMDDVSYHIESIEEKGLPVDPINAYNLFAIYLRWCIEHDLMGEDFLNEYGEVAKQVKADPASVDLRALIRDKLNGQIMVPMFNKVGRAFTSYYYGEPDSPNFPRDIENYALEYLGPEKYYSDEFQFKAPLFIPFDEDYYQAMAKVIEERFTNWQGQDFDEDTLEPSELAEALMEYLDCECTYFPSMKDDDPIMSAYSYAKRESVKEGFVPVLIKADDETLLECLVMNADPKNDADIYEFDLKTVTEYRKKVLSAPVKDGKAVLEELTGQRKEEAEDDDLDWEEEVLGEMEGGYDNDRFSCYWDSDSHMTYPLILAKIPVKNPWEIFAYLPFGNWNECPDTPDLMAVAKYWFEQHGAIPAAMSHDELEFLLPAPVPKEKAMDVAVELYGFCPDLDQNEDGSIGSLADALWQSTVWYFWWD
ncbi:hypothetical protein K370107A2_09790 [Merdimmobilis hominis]|uniref:Uncharacterized protein n=1 Tax=uncultured Anaerotruncus sp. TaxID=905011 RepID=A0A6N2SKB6_9FIRM